MASCSEDGYWNQASPADLGLTNGTSYAFNSANLSYVYYPNDVTSGIDLDVTITRGTSQGSTTLPIAATFTDNELLSGPESVTFADGSTTASYTLHINRELEIGEAVKAKLVIDTLSVGIPAVAKPEKLQPGATAEDSAKFEADSIAYYEVYLKKLSEFKLATTISIKKDFNWISLGKATYREDCLTTFYDVENLEYQLELREAEQQPGYYRLVNPYGEAYEYNEEGDWDENNEYYLEIHAEDPTAVWIDDSDTGCDWGKGNFHIWSMAGRYLNAGYPLEQVKAAGYCGTLVNGIITFPTRGLLIYRGSTSEGLYYANTNGMFYVALPGYKMADYSAEIEYAGLFTDPSNKVYALADYKLAGADAKKASVCKVAVIPQDYDASAVADAIAAGEYPASDLDDVLKNERIQIEIPEGLTGKLQIILVIIDKNEEGTADEVKNVVGAPFEYYAGGNPWKSLGVGYFTDDIFNPYYGYSPLEYNCNYEVEIEEHSETPGLYRIKNMYAPVAADFQTTGGEEDILVHAEIADGGVYIQKQPIGLSNSTGEFSIQSLGGYFVDANPSVAIPTIIAYFNNAYGQQCFGTEANGVITFPTMDDKDSEGNAFKFSMFMYIGENGPYELGRNDAFKIVLPTASAAVKEKAKRAAAANNFERRLKGNPSVKASKKMKKLFVKMPKNISK